MPTPTAAAMVSGRSTISRTDRRTLRGWSGAGAGARAVTGSVLHRSLAGPVDDDPGDRVDDQRDHEQRQAGGDEGVALGVARLAVGIGDETGHRPAAGGQALRRD